MRTTEKRTKDTHGEELAVIETEKCELFWKKMGLEKTMTLLRSDLDQAHHRHDLLTSDQRYEFSSMTKEAKSTERCHFVSRMDEERAVAQLQSKLDSATEKQRADTDRAIATERNIRVLEEAQMFQLSCWIVLLSPHLLHPV